MNVLKGLTLAGLGLWSVAKLVETIREGQEESPIEPRAGGRSAESVHLVLDTNLEPISQPHAETLFRQLDQLEDGAHPLYLHTMGGYFGPAMDIAKAIRRRGNIHAIVPFYAKSAGTLIALACDRIVMPPNATLGAIDPQIDRYSAASLISLVEQKPIHSVSDETWMLAQEARAALTYTVDFIAPFVPEKALERLVAGKVPHASPITREEAIKLGLPIVPVESLKEAYLYARQLGEGK